MSSLLNISSTNIKVVSGVPTDYDVNFPHNFDVCICRVPVRKKDGYSVEMINALAQRIKDHIVVNGIVFFMCYAPTEDKSRPFEISKIMQNCGFTHIDNIIIEKSWLPGKRSEANLVNSHEYVLHFCNGKVWNLDRAPIKKYLNTPPELNCCGNLWKIEFKALDEAIPNDLATLLIQMADVLPGSLIFDPFMGNTSTLKAAIKMSHSFYGIEKEVKKIAKYEKIINNFKNK